MSLSFFSEVSCLRGGITSELFTQDVDVASPRGGPLMLGPPTSAQTPWLSFISLEGGVGLQGHQLDMQILPDGPKSEVDFSEILNAIQESKFHSNFKFTRGKSLVILGEGKRTDSLDVSKLKRVTNPCCKKDAVYDDLETRKDTVIVVNL